MREGEQHVCQLLRGRRALGDDLELHVVDHGVVARLEQKPAGDRAEGEAGRAGIRQRAGQQQAEVLLGCDQSDRRLVGVGGDDHLGEDLDDLGGGLGVELAVEGDDAAEGRHRIAGQGA